MTDIDPYGLDEPARPVLELVELFKRHGTVATADRPTPEAQSDTILKLAAQIRHALENRGAEPIDAIAIVQNFADTISEITVAMETIVDDDHGPSGEWQKIRDHLAGTVSGLGWIANGWL